MRRIQTVQSRPTYTDCNPPFAFVFFLYHHPPFVPLRPTLSLLYYTSSTILLQSNNQPILPHLILVIPVNSCCRRLPWRGVPCLLPCHWTERVGLKPAINHDLTSPPPKDFRIGIFHCPQGVARPPDTLCLHYTFAMQSNIQFLSCLLLFCPSFLFQPRLIQPNEDIIGNLVLPGIEFSEWRSH